MPSRPEYIFIEARTNVGMGVRGDHRTNFLTHFVTRFFPRRLPIRNSQALKLGTPLQLSPCLPFIAIAESLHLSSKVLEPRSVLGRCRRDVTVCARAARWRDPPVLPISLAGSNTTGTPGVCACADVTTIKFETPTLHCSRTGKRPGMASSRQEHREFLRSPNVRES